MKEKLDLSPENTLMSFKDSFRKKARKGFDFFWKVVNSKYYLWFCLAFFIWGVWDSWWANSRTGLIAYTWLSCWITQELGRKNYGS